MHGKPNFVQCVTLLYTDFKLGLKSDFFLLNKENSAYLAKELQAGMIYVIHA
jgi:hypothetical protein